MVFPHVYRVVFTKGENTFLHRTKSPPSCEIKLQKRRFMRVPVSVSDQNRISLAICNNTDGILFVVLY